MRYNYYGDVSDTYPTTIEIRYPKSGTNNPRVRLYVYNLRERTESQVKPPVEIPETRYVCMSHEPFALSFKKSSYSSFELSLFSTLWNYKSICLRRLNCKVHRSDLISIDNSLFFLCQCIVPSISDFYFTWVAWLDSNTVLVNWLRRQQNSSVIGLCGANTQWRCQGVSSLKKHERWKIEEGIRCALRKVTWKFRSRWAISSLLKAQFSIHSIIIRHQSSFAFAFIYIPYTDDNDLSLW